MNAFFVAPAVGSTSEVLKTVLIAGRPIWSPATQAEPFHQVVTPQTPMFVAPMASSVTSITRA